MVKRMIWLVPILLVALAVGCKQAPQAAAPTPAATTAAAPKPPAAPPQAQAAPRGPGAMAGEYEELTLAVTIPGRSAAGAPQPPAAGGHSNCPMTQSSGLLGIQISQPHGVIVGAVVPGGPAEKAGIKVGDSIVACNGKPVTCPASLLPLIRAGEKAQELKLTIRRPKAAAPAPAGA
jgi:S1-C subfamily serine protease